MKPIIYIHAGTYKTGTSSIQNFLFDNRDKLSDLGWYYPLSGCLIKKNEVGHRHYYLMLDLVHKENYKHWKSLIEELKEHKDKNIIISHENFFSSHINPIDMKKLLSSYQIKLIVYFRHPIDYMESCYREWVRRVDQYDKDITTFYKWRKAWLEYKQLLKKWDDTIGSENVIVRMFDKNYFIGGSIENDFLTSIGLEGLAVDPQKGTNTSLNSRQILLYLLRNRNFPNKKNIKNLENLFITHSSDYRILDDQLIREINDNFYNDFLYVQYRSGSTRLINSKYENVAYDIFFNDTKLQDTINRVLSIRGEST